MAKLRSRGLRGLKGKRIWITGATAGIGAELARQLAAAGARILLFGRREDRLQRMRAEVEALGGTALGVAGDVTAPADLERAVAAAREQWGGLDIVIGNAGFGVVGTFERLGLDDYRRQFETNVFGLIATFQAALNDVKASQGQLVAIGSVQGYVSLPGSSPYAMSKFAVRALTEAMRGELASYGVAVTHIAPGYVESEIRTVDNQGRRHEKSASGAANRLQVPTDVAVRAMVRAIAAREDEAVITGHGKAAVFAQRHFPTLLRRALGGGKFRSRGEPGKS